MASDTCSMLAVTQAHNMKEKKQLCIIEGKDPIFAAWFSKEISSGNLAFFAGQAWLL